MADTSAYLRPLTKLEPALQSKVDTLCTVETHVETRMISSRISDDKFVLLLHESVDPNAVLGELGGRDDEGFMAEELVARSRFLREKACNQVSSMYEGYFRNVSPSIVDSNACDLPCGTAYQNLGAPK